jgi:glycosyltransferase involved in cell wall biosynthesis
MDVHAARSRRLNATSSDDLRPERNARRPKLLLLAWVFPPGAAIGAVRTGNLAKYLARLGWDVTVVTPDPIWIRRKENPEQATASLAEAGITRILTGHRLRFLNPDYLNSRNRGVGWFLGGICRRIARHLGVSSGIGWIKPAERACSKLGPADVDLILASGPAFSSFVLAERLAKRLGRPYVLDYRDPWWTEVTSMIRSFQGMIDKLELRLLSGSRAVTIVSPSWALDLDRRFKIGSKLHVITNGYDPEDLSEIQPAEFDHFALVYTGIFYPPIRVVTPILAALKRLPRHTGRTDWCFHYYGDHGNHVVEEARRFGIADRVKIHGKVTRLEALAAVKGAGLTVVIGSASGEPSLEINGWIPAKLFEAIGLGSPVLLIAPPGSDAETISERTGLVHRFSGDDADGVASFIQEQMSGNACFKKDVDSITWKYLATQIDGVLRAELVRSRS